MLTERLQKELEKTYAKGLRRTVDGLRFKTAYAPKMKTAKNILCLQAITTLGLPMRRRYQRADGRSGTLGNRQHGQRLTTRRGVLKPASWRKNLRNLNTPKARWCSIPVT